MSGHFRDLDRRLATNEWLIDGSFTLADVAWTPQVHRMSLMEWPMASYPHLSRWYAQLQKRPSFQEAVVDYEPPGAQAMFTSHAAQRRYGLRTNRIFASRQLYLAGVRASEKTLPSGNAGA